MNANQILERGGSIALAPARIAGRMGRRVVGQAVGVLSDATQLGGKQGRGTAAKPEMDDVTLARKVETEIFRGLRTKPSVNVNVVDGVVWLRGEVKRTEQIRRLEQKAAAVPEVRGVENLLHLTKTPAPTRADTPKRQQRTRSSTRRPAPRRRTGGRVSDDRTDALTHPTEAPPVEHAERGEGRAPAPLGATGGSEAEGSNGGAVVEAGGGHREGSSGGAVVEAEGVQSEGSSGGAVGEPGGGQSERPNGVGAEPSEGQLSRTPASPSE